MLYDYILEKFKENEPILMEELRPEDMTEFQVRLELRSLVEAGKILQYDLGVYYVPAAGQVRSGMKPSRDAVIDKKFLKNGDQVCGYLTGLAFSARMGLTKRVVSNWVIVTNRQHAPVKKTSVGGLVILLKRPTVLVNSSNWKILQLLDLIRDMNMFCDESEPVLQERMRAYVREQGITWESMLPLLEYYPENIYKNLYRCGLLEGYFIGAEQE